MVENTSESDKVIPVNDPPLYVSFCVSITRVYSLRACACHSGTIKIAYKYYPSRSSKTGSIDSIAAIVNREQIRSGFRHSTGSSTVR